MPPPPSLQVCVPLCVAADELIVGCRMPPIEAAFQSGPACPSLVGESPPATNGSGVHVAYLALHDSPSGRRFAGGRFLQASLHALANVQAHADSGAAITYHIIIDGSRRIAVVQRQLCSALQHNFSAIIPRVFMHAVTAAPAEAQALHQRLAHSATGPGRLYLWKNLLHYVLPVSVPRVLLLDSDLFFVSSVHDLWERFDSFTPRQLFGIALEQNVMYANITASGGMGFNTGLMLMSLERMRQSAAYARLLESFAARRLMPPSGSLGWVADQTLYSWATHPAYGGAEASALFHVLPCGWNRQMSQENWEPFRKARQRRRRSMRDPRAVVSMSMPAHTCSHPCHVLHANFLPYKSLVRDRLQADPSGASCASIIAAVKVDARRCIDNGHRQNEVACPDVVFAHEAGHYMLDQVVLPCCLQNRLVHGGARAAI